MLQVEVNFKSRCWSVTVDTKDLLTVGEVARRSGSSTAAPRYSERGALSGPRRTSGGQRRFERNTLRRLAFVSAARNIGLSLDEVREVLAELPESRTPTRADWAHISKSWRRRLDAQIEALEALRDG